MYCLCHAVYHESTSLQVPDEFTEYFMERSGIDISDPRLCASKTSSGHE